MHTQRKQVVKEGDLIAWKSKHGVIKSYGIIIKGPYSKRRWGSSGHPEDIEILTMVKVLRIGPGWPSNSAKSVEYKLSSLLMDTEVVSESR